jgi:hypothetical protein
MTTAQLLFGLPGVFSLQTALLVLYFKAQFDPLQDQVNMLVQFMVANEGRIARLEERTNRRRADLAEAADFPQDLK